MNPILIVYNPHRRERYSLELVMHWLQEIDYSPKIVKVNLVSEFPFGLLGQYKALLLVEVTKEEFTQTHLSLAAQDRLPIFSWAEDLDELRVLRGKLRILA